MTLNKTSYLDIKDNFIISENTNLSILTNKFIVNNDIIIDNDNTFRSNLSDNIFCSTIVSNLISTNNITLNSINCAEILSNNISFDNSIANNFSIDSENTEIEYIKFITSDNISCDNISSTNTIIDSLLINDINLDLCIIDTLVVNTNISFVTFNLINTFDSFIDSNIFINNFTSKTSFTVLNNNDIIIDSITTNNINCLDVTCNSITCQNIAVNDINNIIFPSNPVYINQLFCNSDILEINLNKLIPSFAYTKNDNIVINKSEIDPITVNTFLYFDEIINGNKSNFDQNISQYPAEFGLSNNNNQVNFIQSSLTTFYFDWVNDFNDYNYTINSIINFIVNEKTDNSISLTFDQNNPDFTIIIKNDKITEFRLQVDTDIYNTDINISNTFNTSLTGNHNVTYKVINIENELFNTFQEDIKIIANNNSTYYDIYFEDENSENLILLDNRNIRKLDDDYVRYYYDDNYEDNVNEVKLPFICKIIHNINDVSLKYYSDENIREYILVDPSTTEFWIYNDIDNVLFNLDDIVIFNFNQINSFYDKWSHISIQKYNNITEIFINGKLDQTLTNSYSRLKILANIKTSKIESYDFIKNHLVFYPVFDKDEIDSNIDSRLHRNLTTVIDVSKINYTIANTVINNNLGSTIMFWLYININNLNTLINIVSIDNINISIQNNIINISFGNVSSIINLIYSRWFHISIVFRSKNFLTIYLDGGKYETNILDESIELNSLAPNPPDPVNPAKYKIKNFSFIKRLSSQLEIYSYYSNQYNNIVIDNMDHIIPNYDIANPNIEPNIEPNIVPNIVTNIIVDNPDIWTIETWLYLTDNFIISNSFFTIIITNISITINSDYISETIIPIKKWFHLCIQNDNIFIDGNSVVSNISLTLDPVNEISTNGRISQFSIITSNKKYIMPFIPSNTILLDNIINSKTIFYNLNDSNLDNVVTYNNTIINQPSIEIIGNKFTLIDNIDNYVDEGVNIIYDLFSTKINLIVENQNIDLNNKIYFYSLFDDNKLIADNFRYIKSEN